MLEFGPAQIGCAFAGRDGKVALGRWIVHPCCDSEGYDDRGCPRVTGDSDITRLRKSGRQHTRDRRVLSNVLRKL